MRGQEDGKEEEESEQEEEEGVFRFLLMCKLAENYSFTSCFFYASAKQQFQALIEFQTANIFAYQQPR